MPTILNDNFWDPHSNKLHRGHINIMHVMNGENGKRIGASTF